QQPRLARVRHDEVLRDRFVHCGPSAVGQARGRVQHAEHLVEVPGALVGVPGAQRGRCGTDRTHRDTPWLRQSSAYAQNVNASGVTSALYQNIAANVPTIAVEPASPTGLTSCRECQTP